jgi:hypothetical protein
MYYDGVSAHLIETSILLNHLLLFIFNDLLIIDLTPVALIYVLVLVLIVVALEGGIKASMTGFLCGLFKISLRYHGIAIKLRKGCIAT